MEKKILRKDIIGDKFKIFRSVGSIFVEQAT